MSVCLHDYSEISCQIGNIGMCLNYCSACSNGWNTCLKRYAISYCDVPVRLYILLLMVRHCLVYIYGPLVCGKYIQSRYVQRDMCNGYCVNTE